MSPTKEDMRREDRRKFIAAGIIYVVLLVLIIIGSHVTIFPGGTWDEFAKLAGVWAAFLTALLTAAVTIYVVTKQTNTALDVEDLRAKYAEEVGIKLESHKAEYAKEVGRELEPLKADYAKEVGKELELYKVELAKEVAKEIEPFRAQLSQQISKQIEFFKNDLAKDLEKLRYGLSADLEFLKGRLGAERKAYDELYSAAFIYYQTLASLEVGMCDERRIKKAEDGMVTAGRYTVALPEAHKNLWYKFWQRARKVAEKSIKMMKQQGSKDDLVRMWRENAPAFATCLNDFEAVASSKHETPPLNNTN